MAPWLPAKWWPLLLTALASCAAQARTSAEPAAFPRAFPEICREPVARAMKLGPAIFEQDRVSAWGTDALFQAVPERKPVRGYLTTAEENGWVVRFYDLEGEQPVVRYELRFDRAAADAAQVVVFDPPRALAPSLAAQIRARQAAIREAPEVRCSPSYNTVVLPAPDGEPGWLVYLLAATKEPGAVVVGGHVRRTISPDGSTVVRSEPLSKGCLTLPPPERKGTEVVSGMVTHLVSPCPTEAHVFLSLLHGRPFYVITSTGSWKVSGAEVSAAKSSSKR